jgi:hypothetical protein
MMKKIHQDTGRSAVTSSSGVGADRRRASATHSFAYSDDLQFPVAQRIPLSSSY